MWEILALAVLAAYALWMLWIVSRDTALAVKRRPTEHELRLACLQRSIRTTERTFTVALIPAIARATAAFNEFGKQLQVMNEIIKRRQ